MTGTSSLRPFITILLTACLAADPMACHALEQIRADGGMADPSRTAGLLSCQALSPAGVLMRPSLAEMEKPPLMRAAGAMSDETWRRGRTVAFHCSTGLAIISFVTLAILFAHSPIAQWIPAGYWVAPAVGWAAVMLAYPAMHFLIILGRFYATEAEKWNEIALPGRLKIVRPPTKLLRFSVIRLLPESEKGEQAWLHAEGRTLYVNKDLAAALDPAISPWVVVQSARVLLIAMAAAGHEAFHSLGIEGEGRIWALMHYFPPTFGYAAATILAHRWIGLEFAGQVLLGIVAAAVFTALMGEVVARIAAWRWLRFKLFSLRLALHQRYPKSRRFSAEVIMEALSRDPYLLRQISEVEGRKLPTLREKQFRRMKLGWDRFADMDARTLNFEEHSYQMLWRFDPEDQTWILTFWLTHGSERMLLRTTLIGSLRIYYSSMANAVTIRESAWDSQDDQELARGNDCYREALRMIHEKLDPFSRMSARVSTHDMQAARFNILNTPFARAMLYIGYQPEELHSHTTPEGQLYLDCYKTDPASVGRKRIELPIELRDAPPWLKAWWEDKIPLLVDNTEHRIMQADIATASDSSVKEGAFTREEVDARDVEMNFVNEYENVTGRHPPEPIMTEISRGLRLGLMDQETLQAFLIHLSEFPPQDADASVETFRHFLSIPPNASSIRAYRNQGDTESYWRTSLVNTNDLSTEEAQALVRDWNIVMTKADLERFSGNKKHWSPPELWPFIEANVLSAYADRITRSPYFLIRVIGLLTQDPQSSLHPLLDNIIKQDEFNHERWIARENDAGTGVLTDAERMDRYIRRFFKIFQIIATNRSVGNRTGINYIVIHQVRPEEQVTIERLKSYLLQRGAHPDGDLEWFPPYPQSSPRWGVRPDPRHPGAGGSA